MGVIRSVKKDEKKGYGFGTFQGVFTPSILTIIGVVMYLRFGWMLGNVGLGASLFIVTLGSLITFLTGLSISALATNMRMKGGGAYYMLSRSFGAEAGAAVGIPLALSQALGVSFYIAGFAEALVNSGLPIVSSFNPHAVGFATLIILAIVSTLSADIALKTQYFIMAAIASSLISFFMGAPPESLAVPESVPAALGFWPVFAVFFPAVTGILSGVGMSGDLRNPKRAIPRGTIAAVLTGYAIYMAVPLALNGFVSDPEVLRSDTMILAKCAKWAFPILLGVWAATLSSAVGSFLCAPRVFQALSRDRILPRMFARGWGETDDPRIASALCFTIAAVGLWYGDINLIAPVLTMFNLSTYALLNLSAGLESAMGNPSWRPTFRVKAVFSLLGFALCTGAMFMISPGWTFIAIGCEIAIFWIVKRRALNARWGDMRTGLLVSLARFAMHRLEGQGKDYRNWRPDVLAFVDMPLKSKSKEVVSLGRAISGERGMITLASIVPEAAGTPNREAELADILRSAARKEKVSALARIHAAMDVWTGMRELVKTYGFGPFIPDTVLMGAPEKEEHLVPFSSLVSFLAGRRKNAIFVRGGDPENSLVTDTFPRIDIWWRGKNANGPLMLALAHLMQQEEAGRLKIRLCQLAEEGSDPEEAKRQLELFLAEARIEAETFVHAKAPGLSPVETISRASSAAAYTLVGLRAPGEGEKSVDYAEYFRMMRDATATLPCIVFTLAAEGVDFKRIYRE